MKSYNNMKTKLKVRRLKQSSETDIISNLPEHVIDHVLSHLPIKDAVRTSILARKWRYQWASIPHLVFDDQCASNPNLQTKLINIIDRVIVLHNAPTIHKFKLSHRDLQCVNDVDRWIVHVSRKSVKELILNIWKGLRYKLPSSLFSCESLIHLELLNCLMTTLPSTFKGFKNLKRLDLEDINFRTQDVFENLITSCPLLERFRLMNFSGLTQVNILNAPNLKVVELGGKFDDVRFENTFQVTLVSIGMLRNVENQPGSSSKLLSFFDSLPNTIRSLEIKSFFVKYLAIGDVPISLPCMYSYLDSLSMDINLDDFDEGLIFFCLSRSCPNLQKLEVMAFSDDSNKEGTINYFWEIGDQRNDMYAKLQWVNVTNVSGSSSELNFIRFMLLNSPVLKRMTVKSVGSADARWKLVKELLSFQRTSIAARIVFLDP